MSQLSEWQRPSSAAAALAPPPLVRVTGLTKTYGAVRALRGVDLEIRAGEVHGLIGANGAGKSTLIRALAGLVSPDAGHIEVDGREVEISDPSAASKLRFAFLHQELNLVGAFDALENMSLGLVERGRTGFADRETPYQRARELAEDLEFDFALDRPVKELTVAQQWKVALGRSLMRKARLIAFDEPTAAISAEEAEALFGIIHRLTGEGIAVLYVSHRLEEIRALSSRVTAFRDGAVVARLQRERIDRSALIEAITGGAAEAVSIAPREGASPGAVVLEVRGVTSEPRVRDVSLSLRAGEVVGMAGLVGAGRTELARILFGADRKDSGQILIDGIEARIPSPSAASRLGIGLVPEERRSQALFLDRDVTFNMNVATAASMRATRFGPLLPSRGVRRARQMVERLDVRPASARTAVRNLSGGNQQKVVLGRWLLGDRRILILDEPTRGVDIGARSQIHLLLRELADSGMALLVISSDFEELVSCDRVLVMAAGRLVSELVGDEITEAHMLEAAYAHPDDPAEPNGRHS